MAGDALNFIEIFSSEDDRSPLKPSSIVKIEKDEKNMEDLDCIILDFDPFENIDLSKKLSIEDKPSADDISIIFERGRVACRDYPHSRHLCAKFPFDKTPHESFCEQELGLGRGILGWKPPGDAGSISILHGQMILDMRRSPLLNPWERENEMKKIEKIEKKSARQVCFSKRSLGLFKRAKELSILCGVDIAILTISPAGRLFSSANTDIDSILNRYCKENYQCPTSTTSNGEGGANFWWEKVNVEEIDEGKELQQLRESLGEVKEKLVSRIEELSSLSSLVLSSSNLTKCTAADVKWPSSLDCFSQSSLGDESAANAMHTTNVEPPPLHLPHDGVMQVESLSLDFAKDDDVLMMPSFEEDYDNGLTKSIFEEVDDELMLMSMISRPSTETSFDDMFPPLNNQFGSF
ncbi:hypothetical protein CKAN_01634800 [Cinnamomum micranthum f. kanehirae]|uniref:MADS-box domain-containing protein n=1 Tax=Cinnamomum micranthum f. kanehirae TaxID=337451 RepID=A0A3S3QM81_9MAGN|nr:hypothetical protein CKAN_01634800 [Cinnamomum micranthum f. kanehirae]